MKRQSWGILGVGVVCGLLVACGGAENAGGEGEAMPEVRQPYLELAGGPGSPTGVVLETVASSRYTYARVQAPTEEIWVAAPGTNVAEGDTIYLAGADNMGVWSSENLEQEFEEIFFLPGFLKASASDGTFEGLVKETMNAAGYTYVQVEVSEELMWLAPAGAEEPLVWLAGPETALTVGQTISWQGGSVMREFHSSSLDRTFAEILFVGAFTVAN